MEEIRRKLNIIIENDLKYVEMVWLKITWFTHYGDAFLSRAEIYFELIPRTLSIISKNFHNQ